MKLRINKGNIIEKSIITMASFVMLFCFTTFSDATSFAESTSDAQVVVTGTRIIPEGRYTLENIASEKVYSLVDLKQLAYNDSDAAESNQYVYSAKNNYNNMSIYKVEGVRINAILADAGIAAYTGKYSVRAIDGYEIVFDPDKMGPNLRNEESPIITSIGTRYYYPQIWRAYIENESQWTDEQKREGAVEVPTVIGWAADGAKENGNFKYLDPTDLTPSSDYYNNQIKLSVGQISPEDYNNPLWNGETKGLSIIAGEKLPGVLRVNNEVKGNDKSYSRSDIMLNSSPTRQFTWNNDSEAQSIYGKGQLIAGLLGSNPYYVDTTRIDLVCADGSKKEYTRAEVINNNMTVCFEVGQECEALEPVLETEADGTQSLFTVCGDGIEPISKVTGIEIYNAPPAAPSVPSSFKAQSSSYSSIKLSWTQVKNATGYEVYRKTSAGGSYKKIKTVGKTGTFTNTGLTTGKKYYYRIRALSMDADTELTSYSGYTSMKSATPALNKTIIKSILGGSRCITLKWAKVAGASGYKIYRATSSKGTYKLVKTIKSGKTLAFTNKKLKKGQKFYYKIKAYRNVNGKVVLSGYSVYKYAKAK